MTDSGFRPGTLISPGCLAVVVPALIALLSFLTLCNSAYYDESLEDAATQTVHLQVDHPQFALTELWLVPFEGWGQLALMQGQRALLRFDDSAAARKLAALATQVAVYWLWLLWARRLLPPLALALGSLLFVFPPDNYFGTMIMSHGHHGESLVFLMLTFLLLQRAGATRWLPAGLGVLAGGAVAFYPSNLIYAVFCAVAIGALRMTGLSLWRRAAWFIAGCVIGYLPLTIMLVSRGLSLTAQFTSADDPIYRFCQGVWPLPASVPLINSLMKPGLPQVPDLAVKIWRTLAGLYNIGGGQVSDGWGPVLRWYSGLGALGALLAMAWWLRRGRAPRYVAWYLAVLAAAYVFGGSRFTVALDHPGEPDAFRYLIGLYPVMFAAMGYLCGRLLGRLAGMAGGRSRWPGGLAVVLLLLVFAAPALYRCRYNPDRFGQVFALRFATPAPLGLHYYRHYGPAGLPRALVRAGKLSERWPGTGPLAAELTARGLAVAAAFHDLERAAALMLPAETFRPVSAGWWQGRGYVAARMAEEDRAGARSAAAAAPADSLAAGWYWYGTGLWQGHRPAGAVFAAVCPPPLQPWYWRGYGEGLLDGIVTVNNDFAAARARLDEAPPEYRRAALAGFLRGVLVLARPERQWTRDFMRRMGVAEPAMTAMIPLLLNGDIAAAEQMLAGGR